MLCQQQILIGLGVGKQDASVSSAAINWMLMNGFSMLGGILFAFNTSQKFGTDPKTWRLFADVINDAGLTLTMSAPLFGSGFVFVACLGSICSAICGVAAGATKTAITQHFSKYKSGGILADVYAKEGIQETIVTLVGLMCGTLLSNFVTQLHVQWTIFILLTIFHVYANFKAVTSLSLKTLNTQRLHIIIQHYMKTGIILNAKQVSSRENVWSLFRTPIRIGISLHEAIKDDPEWFTSQCNSSPVFLKKNNIVILHSSAGSVDLIHSFYSIYEDKGFATFLELLKKEEWMVDQVELEIDEGWRFEYPNEQ
ncbi:hypothetical protein HDV06_000339 [Boothiomyces sp. JEL0866]|nr:hypothetical protein HDV06_000339 [Boothiomyces sp. JEL0866]